MDCFCCAVAHIVLSFRESPSMPEGIKTQKLYILQSYALQLFFCHVYNCPRSTYLTRCIRRIFKTVWWTAFGGPLHKVGRFIHVLKVNFTKGRGKCDHNILKYNAFSHILILTIHSPSNGTFSWYLFRVSYHHSCVASLEKSGYAVRPGHT